GPVRAAGCAGRGGGAGPRRTAVSGGRRGTASAPDARRPAPGRRGRAVHGGVRGGDPAPVPRLPAGTRPGRRRARLGAGQRAGRPERGGAGPVRAGGDLGGGGVRTASGDSLRPVADERRAPARGAAADRGGRGGGAERLGAARAAVHRVRPGGRPGRGPPARPPWTLTHAPAPLGHGQGFRVRLHWW